MLHTTTKHSHLPDITLIMVTTATTDTIITGLIIVTIHTTVCTAISIFKVALLGYLASIVIGTFMAVSLGSMAP